VVNDYTINSKTIQLAKVGGNDSKGLTYGNEIPSLIRSSPRVAKTLQEFLVKAIAKPDLLLLSNFNYESMSEPFRSARIIDEKMKISLVQI
jgi:hypothetical protein